MSRLRVVIQNQTGCSCGIISTRDSTGVAPSWELGGTEPGATVQHEEQDNAPTLVLGLIPWGASTVTQILTTRGVDGVSQLGVLPLAQLVLLGAGSSFGGLDLWTSNRKQTQGGYGSAPVGRSESVGGGSTRLLPPRQLQVRA